MNDSYSATRVHVMRTRLIQPADYDRLMKMGDSEIINFLQGTSYKEDVDALDIKDLEDLEAVDKILASNNKRTMKKLKRISSKNFLVAIEHVFRENDAWNLKIIAEAITGNSDPKDALVQYEKRGTFDPALLADVKSIEELASKAVKYFPKLKKNPSTLNEFVSLLNTPITYSQKAISFVIDEKNILTVVRYKKSNVSEEHIIKQLQRGGTIGFGILKKAVKAKDVISALQTLRDTRYRKLIDDAIEHNLTQFEYSLHREILRHINRVTRTYPLGTDVLIHYLAEKEIERHNIRILIKGKRLGLEESFLKTHLV